LNVDFNDIIKLLWREHIDIILMIILHFILIFRNIVNSFYSYKLYRYLLYYCTVIVKHYKYVQKLPQRHDNIITAVGNIRSA